MAGFLAAGSGQEVALALTRCLTLDLKEYLQGGIIHLLIQFLELHLKQQKKLLISTNSDGAFFVLESSPNEISFQLAAVQWRH